MAWTVRTPQGSLDFPTFADVERAYRNGLVDPQDEVREHGKTQWRRADSYPLLRQASKRRSGSGLSKPMWLGVGMALVMAFVALYMMAVGQWVVAFVLALALSTWLFRFTRRVQRPARSFDRRSSSAT